MDEMFQKILANILTIMKNTSLSETFYETVLKRLVSFGYALKETDGWELCFAMQTVENYIKNSCNINFVPEGLFNSAVDRVCGEFLFGKKQSGQLEIEGLDLTGAITSISEGDTSVSFGTGCTDEDRCNQLLNALRTKGESDFVCYRQLKW